MSNVLYIRTNSTTLYIVGDTVKATGKLTVTSNQGSGPFSAATVLTLHCQAINGSLTEINWYSTDCDTCFIDVDENPVDPVISTLNRTSVKALTYLDNGNYTCNGTINDSKITNATFEVIVTGN